MTISIAALCPESGQLGIAISSSSIAVGARCPWLLAGVGAVSSQNITLPSLGPHILASLEAGESVEQALNRALAEDRFSEYRQVTVIDASGEIATFSGEHTLGIGETLAGENCVAAGNMLAERGVIAAMVEAFENATGELASRLIAGLRAGIAAGGEAGPVHSAAVKVVEDYAWPVVDLRVDWADDDPLAELEQLWLAYEPQMEAYITRALDPRDAPSYGVPGDE
ncbi:DUF1028 domain-containing protein [Kluyvera ascorbata]|uniref:DUF1028 domain-containing protein n=1 Tax=Kluyvera ascorbata TaxID=51288 RepID=UPI0022E8F395|nr:DUF1028 domain-containing protein [Kluyvera ascorbata]HDG1679101.1 DUF1028 domain-containing protein [Kluyvera ascorbata]